MLGTGSSHGRREIEISELFIYKFLRILIEIIITAITSE